MLKNRFLLLLFIIILSPVGLAQESGLREISEGKYFTVYAYKGIDMGDLMYKLQLIALKHPFHKSQ